MRRALLCAVLLALAGATSAAAGLPRAGSLVPGRSLGGIALGERAAHVRAALGGFYGVCRGCARTTWYFTYRPFESHGLGVEFAHGRVAAVYTVGRPDGWTGPRGLSLGATQTQVTGVAGPLLTIPCLGYQALVRDSARARTAYYVSDGLLWAFGLLRTGADPCR